MASNLEKYLKSINPLDLKYGKTNLTYRQVLQNEARRLKDLIEEYIKDYYSSYSPKIYKRGQFGGDLLNSLTVDDVCTISSDGKRMNITITINDNAIHNSILDGSEANAFWLLNDERKVKKNVWFKDVYRFGYYEGAHFVEDAVEEFERTSKYGIKVEVVRPLLYY